MINLTICELSKLKRSKMVYISLAASLFAPLMMFLIEYHYKFVQKADADFLRMGLQTNSIITILIGTLLYGLITAHLFNVEFEEDTLKSLFTEPVNRLKILGAKLITLGIWITALTFFTFVIIFLFAQLFEYKNYNSVSMLKILKSLFLTAGLLYPLQLFVVVVTLFFRGIFSAITFTIAAQIVSFVLMRSKYLAIFPWSIPSRIVNEKITVADYSSELSLTILLGASFAALIVAVIKFRKMEP